MWWSLDLKGMNYINARVKIIIFLHYLVQSPYARIPPCKSGTFHSLDDFETRPSAADEEIFRVVSRYTHLHAPPRHPKLIRQLLLRAYIGLVVAFECLLQK